MKLLLAVLLFSTSSFALTGYLTPQDQKYYKNDTMEGNNQRERIDSTVREINKLYGEIANLKSEVQNLKKEIEDMKKK